MSYKDKLKQLVEQIGSGEEVPFSEELITREDDTTGEENTFIQDLEMTEARMKKMFQSMLQWEKIKTGNSNMNFNQKVEQRAKALLKEMGMEVSDKEQTEEEKVEETAQLVVQKMLEEMKGEGEEEEKPKEEEKKIEEQSNFSHIPSFRY